MRPTCPPCWHRVIRFVRQPSLWPQFGSCVISNDCNPFANAPTANKSIVDVGVVLHEPLDNLRTLSAKKNDPCVQRIGKSARENKFATLNGRPRLFEMDVAE